MCVCTFNCLPLPLLHTQNYCQLFHTHTITCSRNRRRFETGLCLSFGYLIIIITLFSLFLFCFFFFALFSLDFACFLFRHIHRTQTQINVIRRGAVATLVYISFSSYIAFKTNAAHTFLFRWCCRRLAENGKILCCIFTRCLVKQRDVTVPHSNEN